MGLGDWDMILGVNWMKNYSPLTFDITVKMRRNGEKIKLYSKVENPTMQLVRGKQCKELEQEKFRNLFALKPLDDPALAKGTAT